MRGNIPFGCGQCLPCRINRRRQWMWRQFLESLTHEENAFVTLTYDDQHIPADGSLEPAELRLFIRRFRKAARPRKFRYFAVGEYGEQTLRPHYHLSLFGVSGFTVLDGRIPPRTVAEELPRLWTKGFVQCAEFNEVTAQYVAGYVVKKLADRSSNALKGKTPEFARMSTNPGLGVAAMRVIADQLTSNVAVQESIERAGDVPRIIKIGRKSVQLPRLLLHKLRKAYGFTDEYIEKIKSDAAYTQTLELSSLFADHASSADYLTPKEAYLKSVHQRILNVESRASVWKKKGSI